MKKRDHELQGNLLKVHLYPDPVLKLKAKPVTDFGPELQVFCQDMLYTMYMSRGVGLAAPQVGKSLRIFVMDVDYEREDDECGHDHSHGHHHQHHFTLSNLNPMVFINPVFKNQNGEILFEEGCLSFPGIYEKVKRSDKVTIDYQDPIGKNLSVDLEGMASVCAQHENDHLEGIVFLQRISLLKRNLLEKKFLKKFKRATQP